MTTTQLIVFGLLIVAFASGWVARGAGSTEPERTPATELGADPQAPADEDAASILREVAAVHEEAIDAWLDGVAPDGPLARFHAELDRLRRADAGEMRDTLAVLERSAGELEDYRRGLPLTAEASKRLQVTEDRIAQALSEA